MPYAFPDSIITLISKLNKLIQIVNNTGITFCRVGIIVDGYFDTEPFDFIQRFYLKDKNVSCNGFDIGFLFNFDLVNYPFNKWVKFQADNGKVIYRIDYNTLQNVTLDFSLTNLNAILQSIEKEFTKEPSILFETSVISG